MQFGEAAAKAHLPELYQMLNDRKAQIEKAAADAAAAASGHRFSPGPGEVAPSGPAELICAWGPG